jgi:hypothetical protein
MDVLHVSQVAKVVLDYSQEVQAHTIGLKRVTEIGGRADHHSRHDKRINFHEYVSQNAEAVGSEIAVAMYFNVRNFVPTVNTFKNEADIGSKVEVKWTKYDNGHLILGPSDRDQDVAVLVTGRSPVLFIAGWLPVSWCKRAKYFNPLDNNFWVNQKDLLPIKDLRKSIYGSTEI